MAPQAANEQILILILIFLLIENKIKIKIEIKIYRLLSLEAGDAGFEWGVRSKEPHDGLCV